MKLVKSPLLSYLLISLIAIACLGTLSQCSSADGAKERGHDPFVLRSVLDQRARMVTLALAPDFWVAYDANHSALFKVWRDGVNFDGPVYTTKHGPQPESMGPYFMVNRFENPWLLKKGGEEMPVLARYRGHRYEKGRAILSYEIALPEGNKVKVEESPEHSLTESGSHILERVFTVEGLPKGSELLMMVSISSIPSEKSIQTDGKLEITQKELIKHPVYKAFEVQGKLRLNPEDNTRLSVTFFSQPLIPNPSEASQVEEEDPAMALIEASGCKTCHNSYEKAIGPAYVEVAKRYPKTEENVEMLVGKIIQGGAGAWGEVVMNAHPTLDPADARTMVNWILELKETGEAAAAEANKPKGEDPTRSVKSYRFVDPKRLPAEGTAGLAAALYPLSGEVSRLPRQSRRMEPVYTTVIPGVHFLGAQAYAPLRENFYATARGTLRIDKDSKYDFRLVSDDGSRLTIDDKIIIDNDGLHGDIAKDGEVNLSAGEHSIFVEYFQGLGGSVWSLQWRPHDSSAFTIVPTEVLSHNKEDLLEAVPSPEFSSLGTDVPGDGSPLQGVHPSYDLSQARPDDFKPKVGGLDFLSDGRLVVSTWTPNGSIYLVEGAQSGDPAQMKAKQIASGLAEPLGLKVVDDEIYVLQKQELTHLIDHNGDDIIDEYRTLCGAWRVSANFHEFAFGLVYQDGYFYAALATAIEPGGKSSSPQIPDRGKVIKISKEDGSHEFLAHGLRTPNGIGIGVDEEIFIADNQGDWLPASKIVHVQPGAWYGSHSVDPEGVKELEETKPVVWLPQDEIGNSPSTPMLMKDGPYAGQMIHGEVTHGGVKRVFVEKVNGQYQGAVFRFTQGLEAGVNRMVWGPDGALYVGGIGSTGNWQHYGTQWYGLQRLKYNGKSTFEMLAVRAKSDGVEIEFTEPLAVGYGLLPEHYQVKQWYYLPTADYGGPKLDERFLNVRSVNLSADRKKVFLELDGMKEDHLVYLRLSGPFVSEQNQELWSTEAWYTLNHIPEDAPGFRSEQAYASLDNVLTEAEEAAGWQLLFDGKSTQGWRNYKQESIGSAWKVNNGMLTLNGPKKDGNFIDGGDIITDKPYANYELRLDWRISKNGNSGIIYNVVEREETDFPWQTGPEMQVLDNQGHPDARIRKHRAGDLYDLIECKFVTVKPAGEWNHARLVNRGDKVEHWLNGYKVVEYEWGTEAWKEMVAKSKFGEMPYFGKSNQGHICLQDHSDLVFYKNIKIRMLGDEL